MCCCLLETFCKTICCVSKTTLKTIFCCKSQSDKNEDKIEELEERIKELESHNPQKDTAVTV